jgi:hypothetical protein
MRRLAHALARRVLGRTYPRALTRWRGAQGAWRSRRRKRATDRFVAWHGLTVSGGPFAGLQYPDTSPHSLVPKLLGIYERELHAAVETAIRAQPDTIVDVGAADGYYAIGLARRCPGARSIVFEADDDQRALLGRVAAANGARAEIRGAATPAALRAVATGGETAGGGAADRLGETAGGALLVMDCEGCERALLEPREIAWLGEATIIVELHDVFDPGVSDAVLARFAGTHDVEIIPTGPQPPGGILCEQRPGPMRWAVMTPRRAPRA